MSKIVVLSGSPRKNGNTERLVASFVKPVKKLGMILVGAAELPELFDSILVQHRLICRFFHLEDAGAVLVRGAREAGAVSEEDLAKANAFGKAMK